MLCQFLDQHFEWPDSGSFCVISCFSHVQLFATLWTVAHQVLLHGILQTRILEWVAMPSSRGSSWPRDQTCIPKISCIGRQVLYHLGSPSGSLNSSKSSFRTQTSILTVVINTLSSLSIPPTNMSPREAWSDVFKWTEYLVATKSHSKQRQQHQQQQSKKSRILDCSSVFRLFTCIISFQRHSYCLVRHN